MYRLAFLSAILLAAGAVAAAALLGGTIVWLLWPVAIPAAFPAVVRDGYLAARLDWWQAVTLTWILAILVKASATATTKKD